MDFVLFEEIKELVTTRDLSSLFIIVLIMYLILEVADDFLELRLHCFFEQPWKLSEALLNDKQAFQDIGFEYI